jgi:dynein heavy chain
VNRISSQLPVIVALGNHDLRPRHWKTIFEQLGMQPVKKFNFSELIANGVLEKREQMEEISARASGEAAIEL